MNSREAFQKWWRRYWESRDSVPEYSTAIEAWQAACQYKDEQHEADKSSFPDLLHEESNIAGDDELFHSIVNIREVSPGIYEMKVVDKSYDCESGILDDWKWKLVLYKEEEEEAKSD